MTNSILLEGINAENLKQIVQDAVQSGLAKLTAKKESTYITRGELARMLHVSLPTIDKGIKNGSLKAYRINGRILFKEEEINLTAIPTRKYV